MKKNLIKKNNRVKTFSLSLFVVGVFLLGNMNIAKASILDAILQGAQQQTNNITTVLANPSSGSSSANNGSILNGILDSAQRQSNNTDCINCNANTTTVIPSGTRIINTPPLPPPPAPIPLNVSCSVNPNVINVGGILSWGVNVSGGNGSYNYSWSGTDGLSGNSPFVSRSYSLAGAKSGTVTVTSGNQRVVRTCNAVVNENVIVNNLSVSCSASPSRVDLYEEVEWRAYVSGGNGSYNYSWSGTDGLSGNNQAIYWNYNDDGTKRANITVYSDGQLAYASCSVVVDDDSDDYEDDLEVSCYANPTNPQIGGRVNWYAQIEGGDGYYRYSWSGTDGLDSSSRSPSIIYYSAGNKTSTVTVRDGSGQRVSRTCDVYVGQNVVLAYSQSNQTPLAQPLAQAVYLNQVPYTGISDDYKSAIFVGILALISAWIAYAFIAYKKNNQIGY
jgi:hypothetical protein